MLKLLTIEWQKIKPYTFFWLFTGVYFFMLFAVFYIAYHLMEINGIKTSSISWHGMTYISGYLNFFLVLLVILYSTNEYQFNTYRQNVIDGLSRRQIFFSKLLINLGIAIYSTLSLFVLFIIFSLISPDSLSIEAFSNEIFYLFYHFIKCFCLLSIAYFLSLVLKKGIISILFFVVVWMVDVVISMATDTTILELLPFSSCGNLIINPMPALPIGYSDLPSESNILYSVIFYVLLFNALSFWWLTKKDLRA